MYGRMPNDLLYDRSVSNCCILIIGESNEANVVMHLNGLKFDVMRNTTVCD